MKVSCTTLMDTRRGCCRLASRLREIETPCTRTPRRTHTHTHTHAHTHTNTHPGGSIPESTAPNPVAKEVKEMEQWVQKEKSKSPGPEAPVPAAAPAPLEKPASEKPRLSRAGPGSPATAAGGMGGVPMKMNRAQMNDFLKGPAPPEVTNMQVRRSVDAHPTAGAGLLGQPPNQLARRSVDGPPGALAQPPVIHGRQSSGLAPLHIRPEVPNLAGPSPKKATPVSQTNGDGDALDALVGRKASLTPKASASPAGVSCHVHFPLHSLKV